ncbi:MAG: efflux RND transporter periplasmic adaptor subunit, partial [Candidatus Krumholzibacteriia bacterium]
TGTIRLKGLFPNIDRLLWPGQFVNVVLTLGFHEGAVIAPASAIQTGPGGEYVFVIKDDQTVEARPVTLDHLIDQEAIVKMGLTPGERVVTDGQLRLSPGVKVEIKQPAAAAR